MLLKGATDYKITYYRIKTGNSPCYHTEAFGVVAANFISNGQYKNVILTNQNRISSIPVRGHQRSPWAHRAAWYFTASMKIDQSYKMSSLCC